MESAVISKTETIEVENVYTHVSKGGKFGVSEWKPASCTEGCAEAARASDVDTCWKQDTCVRWCDEPAILVFSVTQTIPAGSDMLIELEFLNPQVQQTSTTVNVSGTGPRLFIVPTVDKSDPRILMAKTAPSFEVFSVSERECADTQAEPPADSGGIWVSSGKCAGQQNTIEFTIKPNIGLAPGTLITITGLDTGSRFQAAPTIASESNLFVHLGVVSWQSSCPGLNPSGYEASCGILTLRVLPHSAGIFNLEPAPTSGKSYCVDASSSIPSDSLTKFGLVFDMPSLKNTVGGSPSISASHENGMVACSLESKISANKVLKSEEPQRKSFVLRNITQRTCLPGQCSTITVQFAVNDVLLKDSLVVLTMLDGMQKSDSCYSTGQCQNLDKEALPLDDGLDGEMFKSFHRNFVGEATWVDEDHSLKMRTTYDLKPYQVYSVAFKLKNGLIGNDFAGGITILAFTASGGCWELDAELAACRKENMTLAAPTDSSSQAMAVCAPSVTIFSAQSSALPGCGGPVDFVKVEEYRTTPYNEADLETLQAAQRKMHNVKNTITITLKSNIEIPANTELTLSGFTNAIDFEFKDQTLAGLLFKNSSYDAKTFVFTAFNRNPITVSDTLIIDFEMINPRDAQPAQQVSFDASFEVGTENVVIHFPSESGPRILSDLLAVEGPKWTKHVIGQSTTDPYEENTISVTLQSTIEIRKGARITLSGLKGFGTLSTKSLQVTSTELKAYGVFDQDKGTVSLIVDSIVSAGTTLTFSFVLKNPCAAMESSVAVTIQDTPFDLAATCDCPPVVETRSITTYDLETYFIDCDGTEHFSDPGHGCANFREVPTVTTSTTTATGNCTCEYISKGNDCPLIPDGPTILTNNLVIDTPVFLKKMAAQSSCWPESANTVDVTFQTNVMLLTGSKVYISGFSGAPSSAAISLSSSLSSSASYEWDNMRKLVTLTYSGKVAAGIEQVVTLSFHNPAQAQRAPEISIWTANICECVLGIDKEIVDKPEDECSRALAVASPAFCSPCISQSLPYVGSSNTITATICTNVPVKRPNKVCWSTPVCQLLCVILCVNLWQL